jgi:YVTN family beta-propeller protein
MLISRPRKIQSFLLLPLIVLMAQLLSCTEKDFGEIQTGFSHFQDGDGVFIINEGNFGSGNGSLSFLNLDSMKIYNEIFYQANNRPLGDIPFSMALFEEEIWIVVNNSGKIEILKREDMSSVTEVNGFTSPRFLLPVNDQNVYVSDLYSPVIKVVNQSNKQIETTINIGRSSEQMVLAGGKVFVGFWSNYGFPDFENNQLFVIDPETDLVIDSLTVGKEPNSMVVDKNGKLWTLCSGGFMGDEFPTLWRIDPLSMEAEKHFLFSEISSSPASLSINGGGDTLFYLNKGVFRMSVSSEHLPTEPFINGDGRLFYAMGVHPETTAIVVSDAIDYQQRGLVYYYDNHGNPKGSFSAGIIPGRFIFQTK